MAASDARPVPRKNAAFRFYFAIRKPSDSTLITTWAGMDSEVSLDGAGYSDCSNEATEIGTTGTGYIDLTAAEMNADAVLLKVTVTNTGSVTLVFTLFPEEAGDYRVSDTQKVDVETIKTQSLTAAAGITFGVYVGGTAAAAIASTALSTAQWTNTLATDLGSTNTTVATNLNATVLSRLASASYTAPPSAATISTQVAADLATAHGAGSWATATGFSTHSAADVWAVGTRTITGGSLTTAPPTAAAIADEVQTRTIARVTLVDTCTTNTDMRGTDNAALAATALSTAVWTATIAGRIDVVISTRSSQATVDDLPTNAELSAALGTADDATLAAIAAEAVKTANIQTRLPAALESGRIAAVLDTAVETQIDNIENGVAYSLAVLAGACADPQTASETYAITVFGSTFTVDMAGQTSTGTRTAPTLTKT